MAFDWLNFFDAQGIEYLTSGPNVSGKNVAIHCPWCGPEDQSHHLSVSTEGAGYRCWRQHDHRGRNPTRLVQALLDCSWQHAALITGTDKYMGFDGLSRVSTLLKGDAPIPERAKLKLPESFRPFIVPKGRNPVVKPYFDYLKGRGFSQLEALGRRYSLYFATQGPWKGRIIFAVYCNKKLISWTGRTIWRGVQPRYKALTTNAELAMKMGVDPALGPLPDYILWYDRLREAEGRTLYICEGPFDALKVAWLGRRYGIYATCIFTAEPSESQLDYLRDIAPNFKERFALLDQGTLAASMRLARSLSSVDVGIKGLPKGVKDPGELNERALLSL